MGGRRARKAQSTSLLNECLGLSSRLGLFFWHEACARTRLDGEDGRAARFHLWADTAGGGGGSARQLARGIGEGGEQHCA